MFEQHSAFCVHASLSILHSPPPQRPLKHPSEQQSSAFAQATPSAKQAFVHCTTPAIPVTGSQRPLQHCALDVQSVAGPWHAPPPGWPPCPGAPVPPTPVPPALAPPRAWPAAPPAPSPGAETPPPQDATTAIATRQIEP